MSDRSSGTAIAQATAQFQRGDPRSAAELLGPVLAVEPDHLRALVLMTHAQLALKRTDLARQAADHAVRVAPESPEALGALSRVLTALDRHDEAVDLAVAAVRREPENAYRHNRLAWALLGDGGRGAEAEQAARTAVRLDPREADFRITYAMVMKQVDRADRARQALHEALALEPDNAVAQHELATLDVTGRNPFALGRLARGVRGLAGALRTDPRQQASRFMLDVALHRFLVYTAILLALLAYVGWRVSEFSPAGARVLAGAAALAPPAFAALFVARLDRSLRAYLLTVVTQGRQRVAAVGAAACLTLLLGATVAPARWLPWLLGVAAAGGFAVRLLTVSASNAHVRSAGLSVRPDRLSVLLWWVVVLCLVAAIVIEIAAQHQAWWLTPIALGLAVAAATGLLVLVRRRRGHRPKLSGGRR